MAARLATFDGSVRHVTITSVVNQNLHAKVEHLNTEIARRINVLEHESNCKVWSLQCHFKPCADGHVRFIFCSKLALEQVDHTGYAVEPDPLENPSINTSILSQISQDAPFKAPVAKKWDGKPTPADGSIFHIPLPGMTSFREPSWWGAEKLVGITNLLPSATAPTPRPTLPKVWKMEKVQHSIFPSLPPPPTPPDEELDGAEAGMPASLTSSSYTAASPRLPPVSSRSGASSSRSIAPSPRGSTRRLPPADGNAMPTSMVRAVRVYQTTQQPSGLYTPGTMFQSPRVGKHLKEGGSIFKANPPLPTPRDGALPAPSAPPAPEAAAEEPASEQPAVEAAAEEAPPEPEVPPEAAAEDAAEEPAAEEPAAEEAAADEPAAEEAAAEEPAAE